jgi:glyoxylase-like metal-dependent hydrolase (beta-lactamase superfamily II)
MPAPAPATTLGLQVLTSPAHTFGRHGQTFSPTTATLVTGDTEAVLVDTHFTRDDVSTVGDVIEGRDLELTAIVITHAHADHYLGLSELLRRFPQALPVSTAAVAAEVARTSCDNISQLTSMFGDRLRTDLPPNLKAVSEVQVDGHILPVLAVGQGDIGPCAALHIPQVRALIAGDVAYNQIHPMLALANRSQIDAWIDSLGGLRELGLRTVVAGHKEPAASDDDLATILDGTQKYLRDFIDASENSSNAAALVAAMIELYPAYGNRTTLMYSAAAVFAT